MVRKGSLKENKSIKISETGKATPIKLGAHVHLMVLMTSGTLRGSEHKT